MTRICGELKAMAEPKGGGFIVTDTEYTDGSSSRSSIKNRMVFPLIQIGDTTLKRSLVANDQLGNDVWHKTKPGDKVCLFVFGHLLTRKMIIGVQCDDGRLFSMPARGYVVGLLLYVVFSPVFVGIPAVIVGMLVGMVGGQKGTAFGLLCGVLYAVGISWFTAYRFHTAYREMRAGGPALQPA